MIIDKIDQTKTKAITNWPVNSNRASNIGHDCLRYLVYLRTSFQERTPISLPLKYIFDLGNSFETIVLRELQDAGFELIEQQKPIFLPEYNITGHLDALIKIDGHFFPLEIKSISPFLWNKITTFDSIRDHSYLYIRTYYAQITIYMYSTNSPKAVFLFKNKSSGQYKEIWVEFDPEYCNSLSQKAQIIEQHLKNKTFPDGVSDAETCCRCDFKHICENKVAPQAGIKFMADAELYSMLERQKELRPLIDEYNKITKKIKYQTQGLNAMCNKYLIETKKVHRKAYTIPQLSYDKTTITKIL